MPEVALNMVSTPSLQFIIPSIQELIYAYVKAHGYEPAGNAALEIEGDLATVQVVLGKSQKTPYHKLSEDSLKISLDH
ncbi:MAG: hypothetical protein KC422_00035 [Trueperaceae bacterium]|nr:hypothetical protein [Trueperaceae bacterium]